MSKRQEEQFDDGDGEGDDAPVTGVVPVLPGADAAPAVRAPVPVAHPDSDPFVGE